MSGLLAVSGISFSTKRKTGYGLPEWTAILVEMCSKRTTAEAAARNLGASKKMPGGRWFRDVMHTICPNRAEAFCGEMLGHTVHLAKRAGMRGGQDVPVAIDKHPMPRFDAGGMPFLVFSARKNGTNRFEAYATMQVVAGPINAILDCVKFTRDMDNVDFVRRFVHILGCVRIVYSCKPRRLIADWEWGDARGQGCGYLWCLALLSSALTVITPSLTENVMRLGVPIMSRIGFGM